MIDVYLSLGSNLGDRAENLRKAIASLSPEVLVDSVSPVYETEPKYLEAQPKFLNVACKARTKLSAREVINRLKSIEMQLGRAKTERYGPRIIDIDLLFYGKERTDEPGLTVPHPRISERAFVLVPLADIAQDFVHPVLQSTIQELKEKLGVSNDVRKTEIKL